MRDINPVLTRFIYESAKTVSEMYGDPFPGWDKFPLREFIEEQYLFVCYKNGQPVGFLAARKFRSFFTADISILMQQLLYAKPGTRAAVLLMREFLDFGKYNANHVLSGIGAKTNIKPNNLKRLGFEELETIYRWKR